MIERVVFDTSALVGAVLKVGSKPHRALILALASCLLLSSEQLIAELVAVLNRGYFERRLPRADRDQFVATFRENVEICKVDQSALMPLDPPCRDAKDNFVLALALSAQAYVIVSSDQDLFVLHPRRGIAILTPAQFLAELGS